MDHANLAESLLNKGSYSAAIAACEVGLQRSPENLFLRICLGRAYDGLGRPAEALAECDRVLEVQPAGDLASAANVLKALVYTSLGDGDAAFAAARRALELAPDDVHAHCLIGSVMAWHGYLEEALAFIEWNWIEEQLECNVRHAGVPMWTPGMAPVRRLLVAHGQGLGDAIQMARYLPQLHERADRVVLECAPPLLELLRDAPGVDEVVVRDRTSAPEPCDAYVRTMTLPRLLGLESGAGAAYLHADPGRIERFRPRMGADGALRVGIVWAGNAGHGSDFRRSMPFAELRSLEGIGGIRWFSLMNGARADEAFADWEIDPLGDEFGDLADAAAAIAQLDLVITVDTAIAHLAGALGRPVWMMLPRRPDWRWGGSGECTSWYPSMRIFREPGPEWSTVVPRIRAALLDLLAARVA
jgi:hypothetical protein